MKVMQMGWRLLVLCAIVGLAAGCSSPTATPAPTAAPTTAPTVAPTAAPTVDPQPTYNAIKTQAAATVIANLTQTAPSATPPAPAASATATKAPAQPTAAATQTSTSLPRPTSTTAPILTPWTLVPTKAAYNCLVTNYAPKSNVSYPPSANFDAQWVVLNNGAQKWPPTETVLRYVDGVKMQKYGDAVLLTAEVAANATYTLGVDMIAPATAGTYNSTWKLTYGNVTICTFGMSVVVK